MTATRRQFLHRLGLGAGCAALGVSSRTVRAQGRQRRDGLACLMDVGLCVGCRECEAACGEENGLGPLLPALGDAVALDTPRRPSPRAFTVVNRAPFRDGDTPLYTKVQCMHCLDPSCVSACPVGALRIDGRSGAVGYDSERCIGCRYCMIACPFQVLSYEYAEPRRPRVRKCQLCSARVARTGGVPACVARCPREALLFGERTMLLRYAHQRITEKAGRYVPLIYGEHEVGGARWLYIAPLPFEHLGFLTLPAGAPARRTEALQAGLFKGFAAPLSLYALLGVLTYLLRPRPAPQPEEER